MKGKEILIIDDEPQIRKLLEITLTSNDYLVRSAENGRSGLLMAKSFMPDLVLLDIGLPDMNGQEVLTKLREWYTRPIVMLSVHSAEEDIVMALDHGANDYLVKPFRTGELLARIRNSLKDKKVVNITSLYVNGELEVDLEKREVKKNKETVKLTSIEYKLLTLFIANEGNVLTHDYLLKEVWGPGHINQTQYLRVFIAQLRKKIESEPNQPQLLVTESGVGYRFISKNIN
jgi:two-component system KDP operon response regulator KdpE